ncbi:hypothetical protein Tco_0216922 [Tanacetum coccineum]
METQKPLLKEEDGKEVDFHLYRSMIGSLMYLTSSRPDIMFPVCACARYQVNPKVSHLHAVIRNFRYLKGQPKLGLWYPKDSPFDLVAYTDSDYAGASLDRKSTTGGCQFLGYRLISWQCKKQTVVANSITEAEYVVASTTNQKFNFSKYIFESMVKNLDSAGKFLMYPRFVQVFLDNQLEGMINHNRIYIAPSHTKKVFANMKRQGKDFCGRVTPLFLTMMVQAQQEHGEGSDMPTIISPSTSQPQRKQRPRKPKRKDTKIPQSSVLVENVADAIICLATNQKFNFSKYIFDSMVKNVDNVNNFLMYSRFVHVFVNQQAGDMSNHKRIYVTPSHTKKVFRNMKMEGKGFFRRVTPLFPTMMVQALEEIDEAFTEDNVSKHSNDSLLSCEHSMKLEELMELCTNLQQRVIDLETSKTTQGKRVESSDEASLGDQEDASKQRRKIDDIDADAGITLVDETHGRHDDDLMFNTGVLNDDEVLTG